MLAAQPGTTRTDLARLLCEEWALRDHGGKPQLASCLKGLRVLDAQGVIRLPAPVTTPGRQRTPRGLEKHVPLPATLPPTVDGLGALRLKKVESAEDFETWNGLVANEHPQGKRPLVGRQLRYLVLADEGVLGAIGLGSAALQLKARDTWIGWSSQQRRDHLDKVVCLSRFLIRPGVECKNLASKALGLLRERVQADFEAQYGYRPWLLESFTEESQAGTSYQASGWNCLGKTCGRGRQDRDHQAAQGIKNIWVLALDPVFREQLGLPEPVAHPPLKISEGLEKEGWARCEFGGASLGDGRLSARLVAIAHAKGDHPGASILQTVSGSRAQTAGYYRFVDRPAHTEVTMENILAPHRERTLGRIQGQRQVLCIHDTTGLNFDQLKDCVGLGVIGKNQTKTETQGLELHSSYVVSRAEGLPLGLLHWRCSAPELRPERRGKDHRYIPPDEKETWRWVESMRACGEQARRSGNVEMTHVMDREADFFELFHAWREAGLGDHLIVRADKNRRTDEGAHLFDRVRQAEAQGELLVTIPRKSPRAPKGGKEATPARPKREARLQLRWREVKINPCRHGVSCRKEPVSVGLLHARELDAHGQGKPLEWFLITTRPIAMLDDAQAVFMDYAKRWRIEDWHRILKSCCKAEEMGADDAESLRRILAVNMVIAWRVHVLVLLGREQPDLPMSVVFSDMDIRVLCLMAKRRGFPQPTNLGEAIITVARLGGYLHRKHDPPPGSKVLWLGLLKLMFAAEGAELVATP